MLAILQALAQIKKYFFDDKFKFLPAKSFYIKADLNLLLMIYSDDI
jgi:hypothetical protein